jgi:hypothetical protein
MAEKSPVGDRHWAEKLSRSSYFFGALLLHLIVFFMVATWVIFPAFHPPTEDFTKTYLPPSSPPPPPPPTQPAVQVPTHAVSAPTTTIVAPTATAPPFTVPMPDITPATTQVDVQQTMTQKPTITSNTLSEVRLAKIMDTEKNWGRSRNNILESGSDPKNVIAKFPVYLASYANGDWGCNTHFADDKIDAGSLPDLVAKMNEWSKGHITGEVIPTPLDIGGRDLLDKKPPFIFFTGHKDFTLTDAEIQNLRDYLQVGGAIWGDNALAGRGSRFDVAFRREMKRVVPDLDKNFEPVPMNYDIFTKSWFPIAKVPEGMNYFAEPLEHLDIDGKLAILYTPNDYSDLFFMRILPGDTQIQGIWPERNAQHLLASPLFTSQTLLWNRDVFFRNFELPSCLAAQQLGMNIIGYMLVRFDKDLLLAP